MGQIVDLTDYTVEDYNAAKDALFDGEEPELEAHPWMWQLMQDKGKKVVDRAIEERRTTDDLAGILRDEFLSVLAVGIFMGEGSGDDTEG